MNDRLVTVRFDAEWERLSAYGKCDAIGGGEYRRVLREWLLADEPVDIYAFIVTRANVGPEAA